MIGLYFWQLTDKRQKKELMSFYLYIIINLEFEASNASKQYIICTGLGKSLKLKQKGPSNAQVY